MRTAAVLESAETAPAMVGVIDRNRTVLTRAARVVRAAADLAEVAFDDDPAALRARLSPETRLLVCEGSDLDLALEWAEARYPRARVITWSHGPMDGLIELAHRHPRVISVLGWPSFVSMPRSWELGLAVRRALVPRDATIGLAELFAGGPMITKFRPASSAARDQVVGALTGLAGRAGVPERLARKIGEVSHELLMNAIYGAPVNHYGEPRYAYDRRAEVALDPHEVPSVRFATDGALLAIQVSDPFGRLTRDHALGGIARGQAASGSEHPRDLIDASRGGAGLGLWKVYSSSAITIVDVIPGHATSVTAIFDIDVGPRDARTMPPSLHLFDARALTSSPH